MCFSKRFLGADILRLSKKDIVLIAGNAEGIRLHNLIQTRYNSQKTYP